MLSIRAGYFTVHWGEDTPDGATAACRAYAAQSPPVDTDISINGKTFRLTNAQWDEEASIFSATMWRVRTNNLPSLMKGGQMVQVENDLAESASFAFMPSRREALVQYNHSGPRHGLISAFMEAIGLAAPVALSPVIQENALERMKVGTTVVRRLEFGLGDITNEEALRGAGVGAFVDQMKGLQGAYIRVEISLGHNPGGLSQNAKVIAEKLAEFTSGVKTVKVGIKESEDASTEMLDVLGGRLFIDVNLPELGRELDRAACRNRLKQALKDRQTSSEESEDDEPIEPAAAEQPV